MTWNIAGAISDTSWDSAATQSMGRVINYYQPDIVGFCEADYNGSGVARTNLTNNLLSWANANLTNWPNKYVYVSTASDGYESDAFVCKYPLSNFTQESCSPRGLVGAMFTVPGSVAVKVYLMHLKAFSDSASASTRQSGASSVTGHVSSWSGQMANCDIPYIVMGDMNEDEENPQTPLTGSYHPITTLLQSFVQDYKPDDGYGNTKTYSSGGPTRRFDHVMPSWLMKYNWTNVAPLWSRVINTNSLFNHGALPAGIARMDSQSSDHLPVIGTFDILDNTLTSVRATADGAYTAAAKKYVTASYSDHFYIQDPNGAAAIRVNNASSNPVVGSVVNVTGAMSSTAANEIAITTGAVRVIDTLAGATTPISLCNAAINGQPYNGNYVDGYIAPSNAARLVKTSGLVSSPDGTMFYVDDGSGYPVKVQSSAAVTAGSYATAMGVVGFYVPDGWTKPQRFIKTRTVSDVDASYAKLSVLGARGAGNGSKTAVSGTVTLSTTDHFYIEDSSRLCGIRVNSSLHPTVGHVVDVLGTTAVAAGVEDSISPTDLYDLAGVSAPVQPIAMSARSICGESCNGVAEDGAVAPINPGLLVKICGQVVADPAPAGGIFYLDDGSGYAVRISSPKTVGVGDYVSVVGVIGFYTSAGKPARYLETRDANDVQ